MFEEGGVSSFLSASRGPKETGGAGDLKEKNGMEESDYGKYFITDTPRHPDHPQSRERDGDVPWCAEKSRETDRR
jgi:hypothetical protein